MEHDQLAFNKFKVPEICFWLAFFFTITWLDLKMTLFVFRAETHAGFYDEPELWGRELDLLNMWEDHAGKERHA